MWFRGSGAALRLEFIDHYSCAWPQIGPPAHKVQLVYTPSIATALSNGLSWRIDPLELPNAIQLSQSQRLRSSVTLAASITASKASSRQLTVRQPSSAQAQPGPLAPPPSSSSASARMVPGGPPSRQQAPLAPVDLGFLPSLPPLAAGAGWMDGGSGPYEGMGMEAGLSASYSASRLGAGNHKGLGLG